MNEEHFKIRPYGIGELALLYNPEMHPHSANRKLRKWMALSPGLMDRLKECGWKPQHRTFTPAQVRLIVAALGEP